MNGRCRRLRGLSSVSLGTSEPPSLALDWVGTLGQSKTETNPATARTENQPSFYYVGATSNSGFCSRLLRQLQRVLGAILRPRDLVKSMVSPSPSEEQSSLPCRPLLASHD